MQRFKFTNAFCLILIASFISIILGKEGLGLEYFTVKDGRGEDFPLSKYDRVPVSLQSEEKVMSGVLYK